MPSCGIEENERWKKNCSAATLQLYIILQDTAIGPAGYIQWLLLIVLIYLKGQREARSDNCKAMVCLSCGVWKGMDKSVRTKSLLFFACFYYDKVIIFYVASPGNQPFSWAM